MQKEFLIETRTVTDEKGTLLNLKYYLIEEEASPLPDLRQKIPIRTSRSGRKRKHSPCFRFGNAGPSAAPPAYHKRCDARVSAGDRRRHNDKGGHAGVLKGITDICLNHTVLPGRAEQEN